LLVYRVYSSGHLFDKYNKRVVNVYTNSVILENPTKRDMLKAIEYLRQKTFYFWQLPKHNIRDIAKDMM